MGVLVDYFAAASSDQAVRALDVDGGPGGVGSDFALVAPVRLMPSPDLHDIVVRLTRGDQADEDVIEVGERDDYSEFVLAIPTRWVTVLARADGDELRRVALEFRRAPENQVLGGPDPLTTDASIIGDLQALASLARDTVASNLALFCWICV